ncbi:hypothetical protein ACQ86N_01350 [Puia sp. P3]|uniref:hypothetical protein n=1 Tax=Puia sp. P3 TaxID=3423952 RepID=UPI003D6719CB
MTYTASGNYEFKMTMDIANLTKPEFKALIIDGKLQIEWAYIDFYALEIWVDRGNGNFSFLAVDTIGKYVDICQSYLENFIWRYKARYKWDIVSTGPWSDVVIVKSWERDD